MYANVLRLTPVMLLFCAELTIVMLVVIMFILFMLLFSVKLTIVMLVVIAFMLFMVLSCAELTIVMLVVIVFMLMVGVMRVVVSLRGMVIRMMRRVMLPCFEYHFLQ